MRDWNFPGRSTRTGKNFIVQTTLRNNESCSVELSFVMNMLLMMELRIPAMPVLPHAKPEAKPPTQTKDSKFQFSQFYNCFLRWVLILSRNCTGESNYSFDPLPGWQADNI